MFFRSSGTATPTSTQLCPTCDNEISPGQINITEGVALCDACGELTRLSQLNYSGITISEAIESPPEGATISSSHNSLQISITLFSLSGFLGSLAITLFWNGIVSVFLSVAAAGIYYNLIGPVPDWFPTMALENGAPNVNDEPMGPGMTVFMCLFPRAVCGDWSRHDRTYSAENLRNHRDSHSATFVIRFYGNFFSKVEQQFRSS